MSLFIGNDITNRTIVHITNKDEPLDALRGEKILPSTTFHSCMQYLRYDSYDVELVSYSQYDDNINYDSLFIFPLEARKHICNGKLFICTVKDTSTDNVMYLSERNSDSINSYQCHFYSTPFQSSDSYINGIEMIPTNYSDNYNIYPAYNGDYRGKEIRIHFFNINYFSFNKYYPLEYSCKISPREFIINGENFLNMRYISPEKINDIDPIFTMNNHTFQLVNYYKPITSNMELITSRDPSTGFLKIDIKAGENNKTIFTSDYTNSSLSYDSYIEFDLPNPLSNSFKNVMTEDYRLLINGLEPFNNNDFFVFIIHTTSSINYLPDIYLFKYISPDSDNEYKTLYHFKCNRYNSKHDTFTSLQSDKYGNLSFLFKKGTGIETNRHIAILKFI